MLRITVIFACILAMGLLGCANSKPAKDEGPKVSAPMSSLPSWVAKSGVDGSLSAVGIGAKSKAGVAFQRDQAMADARVQISKVISTKIQNSLTNFSQTTGVGDSQTVDAVGKTTTKELTNQVLSGTKQQDTYIDQADGTMYVLVVVDSKIAEEAAKSAAKIAASAFGNANAQSQIKMNEKALEELEKDMKDAFK